MEALEIRAITSAGTAFVGQCVALPDVSSPALCLGSDPQFTGGSKFLQRVALDAYRVRETLIPTPCPWLPLVRRDTFGLRVWRAMGTPERTLPCAPWADDTLTGQFAVRARELP